MRALPCWWQKLHWEMKASLVALSGNGNMAAWAEAVRVLDSSSTEAIFCALKSTRREPSTANSTCSCTSLK
ncbi:hypothetical protein D9M71_802290 [compost metagenome]